MFLVLFVYLSQEKEDEALAVIIRFPVLLVFDSRESEGLLGYHSSSGTLGVQVRRQWRTFEYLAFFSVLWILSREKVEDVSAIIILFPLLWEPPDVPWVSLSSD